MTFLLLEVKKTETNDTFIKSHLPTQRMNGAVIDFGTASVSVPRASAMLRWASSSIGPTYDSTALGPPSAS